MSYYLLLCVVTPQVKTAAAAEPTASTSSSSQASAEQTYDVAGSSDQWQEAWTPEGFVYYWNSSSGGMPLACRKSFKKKLCSSLIYCSVLCAEVTWEKPAGHVASWEKPAETVADEQVSTRFICDYCS